VATRKNKDWINQEALKAEIEAQGPLYSETQKPLDNGGKQRFNGLAASTVGAISELAVCADLLSKGYDVFRSVSPAAPCDLIAQKEGKLIRVEVKTNASKPDAYNVCDIVASYRGGNIKYYRVSGKWKPERIDL
jgi:hypothetical protein